MKHTYGDLEITVNWSRIGMLVLSGLAVIVVFLALGERRPNALFMGGMLGGCAWRVAEISVKRWREA